MLPATPSTMMRSSRPTPRPMLPPSCRRACRARPSSSIIVCSSAALPFPVWTTPEYSSSGSSASTSAPQHSPAHSDVGADTGFRTCFSSVYTKGHQLGQGSFGTVFRGTALESGTEVAIKVMPKIRGKLSKDATLEKICREVDFLERVQGSRGVVQVLECFEEPNEILVVTELCAGGDLQRLSDAYPVINERCLALIATEVLKVIQACNSQGMTHGDIKPANFVLKHPLQNPLFSLDPAFAAASWLKAIDFGCSQVIPGVGCSLSKRAGTPVFMAPEIFERSYGREADVWSAGILLYQVFCKRFPFWDTYETAKTLRIDDISLAVCNSAVRLDFGPWLAMSPEGLHFIQGLLTRDPGDRLTVQEALAHPWIALATGQTAPAAAAAAAPASPPAATPVRASGNNIVRRPAVHRAPVAAAV